MALRIDVVHVTHTGADAPTARVDNRRRSLP
jgi:hypothetical protein